MTFLRQLKTLIKKVPLRLVLVIPFVILVSGTVVLTSLLSYHNQRQTVADLADQLLGETARRIDTNLDHFFAAPQQVNQLIDHAVRLGLLDIGDLAGWPQYLRGKADFFPTVTNIAAGNQRGEYIGIDRRQGGELLLQQANAATGHTLQSTVAIKARVAAPVAEHSGPYDPRLRPWYQVAAESGQPRWSAVYRHFVDPVLQMALSLPIKDDQGRLQGVCTAAVRLPALFQFLERLQVGRSGVVYIVDDGGLLLATSAEQAELAVPAQEAALLSTVEASTHPGISTSYRCLQAQSGGRLSADAAHSLVCEDPGGRLFIRTMPFNDPHGLDWQVVVVAAEQDFITEIRQNFLNTLALCLLALLLSIASGVLIARWVARPIALMNQASADLAAGRKVVGLPTDRGDELGTLARSFARMVGSLQQTLADLTAELAERRRTEEQLSHQTSLFRHLFEGSPAAIAVLDEQDCVVELNRSFTELFGYSQSEAVGRHINELLAPEPYLADARAVSQAVIGESRVVDKEGIRCTKAGKPIQVSLVGYPLIVEGRQIGAYAIYRDITEHKLAEAQLVQAQKMESVGRLAGGVAHDFNNMLGVILGHSEMGLLTTSPDQPVHQTLAKIQLAAQRSTELTRQLLAFARRQTIAPRVLDLNDTVGTMLDMLQRLIGEDIDLLWHPRRELWPVKIDPAQVDQLLANLCVNARDAIAGVGKITIETGNVTFDRAYCTLHPGFRPGEYAMLAVSDDGQGMDKQVLEQIFEPFFTTKGAGKGTGLGLAMVYGIVKQNQGFVNVYSEPGKGSTFKIYLPRVVGDPVESENPLLRETPKGEGELILLVEDEKMILEMTREMLEDLGYRVLSAGSPDEALTAWHSHTEKAQLLLTDVVMPGMNGRDLAREIMAINPATRCLFVSGYTANVIAHHGVLDPGVDFLQKPFTREDLALAVRRVLAAEFRKDP